MPDVDLQSGRSNSFRRMMELERAYMIERLQANRPARKPPAAPKPPRRSPEDASLQTRRAKTRSPETADVHNRGTSPPPKRSSTLVVDTGSPAPLPDSTPRRQEQQRQQQQQQQQQQTTTQTTPQTTDDPDKMPPQVVTRPVSPPEKEADEKSICVSPSWEAHGRRRKEKKMEKREKEEAAKTAQAKAKKARLSKQPPPASSTDALRKVEGAVTDSRGRMQDRPANAAIKSPDKETAPRKPRSRSSSFASLIRSPLGFRRQSIEPVAEPEFVGGIKLELERHLANERILNLQAKGDEADLHPALRGKKPGNRSGPLRSPPPPGRPSGEANSRSYPPITRHEKYSRNRALVSPTAPAVPDFGKIDRWRARVGLRPSSQPPTPTSAGPETQPEEVENAGEPEGHEPPANETTGEELVDMEPNPTNAQEPVETPALAATADESHTEQAHHIAFAGILPAHEAKDGQELSIGEPDRPNSGGGASTGYRTAPSTPPPDPPLRSPKRSSLPHADDAVPVPPLPAEAAEAHRVSLNSEASVPEQSARHIEARRSTTARDAVPTSSTDKADTKPAPSDVSREVVRRSLSPMPRSVEAKFSAEAKQKPPPQVSWTARTRNLAASSPDESCSDEFHSPSPPSTPATSRSELDKGLPMVPHGPKGFSFNSTATKVSRDDARPATRATEPADGKGKHEFKDQVLASYREATAASPSLQGRGDHSALVANRSLLPVPNHQGLTTKDKGSASRFSKLSMAPGSQKQSWGAPQLRPTSPRPEAANYLEEARRLPPARSARGAKMRLGPPASFALPGDLPCPPTPRSEGSRPSEASQYLPHLTTPGPGARDREPIAKMFVECCRCKFYHDMPSNLYEAMANPESALSGRDTMGYAGSISMTVKCPWCRHEMSTRCCAGLAAMVYVTERLH